MQQRTSRWHREMKNIKVWLGLCYDVQQKKESHARLRRRFMVATYMRTSQSGAQASKPPHLDIAMRCATENFTRWMTRLMGFYDRDRSGTDHEPTMVQTSACDMQQRMILVQGKEMCMHGRQVQTITGRENRCQEKTIIISFMQVNFPPYSTRS